MLNKIKNTNIIFKNIPTRSIRYKQTCFLMIQKNSIKVPIIKPTYKIFNIYWNKNMTQYKIKNI